MRYTPTPGVFQSRRELVAALLIGLLVLALLALVGWALFAGFQAAARFALWTGSWIPGGAR